MRKKEREKSNLSEGLNCFLNGVVEPKIFFGSPTWIRTRDLRINSPSLYRLSYQGIDKTGMILSLGTSVKD